MTRIVVVDDHPVFRKGLVALLRASGFDVVGEASNGLEALDVVADARPEVVLMDVSMPELGGIDATARLLARDPSLRVVFITQYDDPPTVTQAIRAGASAYVTKQATPEQILAAIDAAISGALLIGPGAARPILPESPPDTDDLTGLTTRERAVADLLSRGLDNHTIAERLVLSPKTAANYVSNILLKLGAADRADAARIIRRARGM